MGEKKGAARRPLARLGRAIVYGIFLAVRWALVRRSRRSVLRIADCFAAIGYLFDRRHRKVAHQNVKMALPELSEAERLAVVRGSYRSFSRSLLGNIASTSMSQEQFRELLIPEGWHYLEEAEAEGKGFLLMTAHYGDWEAAGQLFALRGRPLWYMARPIDDPRLGKELRFLRERYGNHGTPKRGGVRDLLTALRRQGGVFLMIDQRVHPNEGKAYRFFGRPAYTSPLLASLSLKTGAPVVPFYGIPTEDGEKVRVVLRPPIRPCDPAAPGEEHLDSVDRLTLRYNEELERAIRERPDLWLWMHRRWRRNPTHKQIRASARSAVASGDVCIERAECEKAAHSVRAHS